MKPRDLPLLIAVLLSGCLRTPGPRPAPLEDNPSFVFPQFFEHAAVQVGAGNAPYELDGVTLRALSLAANDFLPPSAEKRPCQDTQVVLRYRFIRQGSVIFVRIYEDPALCGLSYLALDSGAKYAISTDGRILRRVFDGQPEGPFAPESADAGTRGIPGVPGVSPTFDSTWDGNGPSPYLPLAWQDAGSTPALDGGAPETP
jgi:hypothetical protein